MQEDVFPVVIIGAVTVMFTDWLVVPPVPVQESVKVEFAVRLPVDCEPEVALVPDQAPDAVQEVALDEDQERVEAVPDVTEVGLAERETVGAGVTVVPPVLHSEGIAPKICSICWVTEFPVPPKIESALLPEAITAALILASIGHGQRGLFVRVPFTYCLQTLAPLVPAPFQIFGAAATELTKELLLCVQSPAMDGDADEIVVTFDKYA